MSFKFRLPNNVMLGKLRFSLIFQNLYPMNLGTNEAKNITVSKNFNYFIVEF